MDGRLPSASLWAVHRAAPALKVTFTGTPRLRSGLRTWGPWEGHPQRTHACKIVGTRARTRGLVPGCAAAAAAGRRTRRPHPLRAPAWGAPGAGDADPCGPASVWSLLS